MEAVKPSPSRLTVRARVEIGGREKPVESKNELLAPD
jgi:hypothetical protein